MTDTRTILIVDDELPNIRLMQVILKRAGYLSLAATSGIEAMRVAQKQQPDLIMLDINMPDMDGYETCEGLKAEIETRHIPVIFVSALSQSFNKVQAFKAGGVDYVTKPYDMDEVLARVDTHLTICNLRLQLEQANKALEQRVAERTAELSELNAALQRFVPHQFLGFLERHSITEVQLGDQVQKEMTILFADIRDFTSLSETMTPEENFRFVNNYLSRMEPCITQHGGFIDKYIGDGIMALFPTNPDDAVLAAIAMLQALRDYNQQNDQPPIHIGIGIHTGLLMLGIVGGPNRIDGTVISDAVNLAARLETATKRYGVSILLSEYTLSKMRSPELYHFRLLDVVQVKGRSRPVSIVEVFDGDESAEIDLKTETLSDFEQGLLHFHNQKYEEARIAFDEVLKKNPNDQAARFYLRRVAQVFTGDID